MTESSTGEPPLVLVVCTGNSCRSQMAEAFLRRAAAGRFRVASAGTEPAADVHPLARRVMTEAGVELEGHEPKGIEGFYGRVPVHTLVLVCDGAAKSCPAVWPGVESRLHWPFEDPAVFRSNDEATLAKFREIREQIRERVDAWLGDAAASSSESPPTGRE